MDKEQHRRLGDHLHGIVDMGSNGIRFSISDLSPPTARSLPTVFQSRTGISLYDAQYSGAGDERGPVPQPVINSVLGAMVRFKAICADFGVPESNIKILATEATRTAPNSTDFRRQIKHATGWEVDMLTKEMEGTLGTMGVASSLPEVEGLVMDLGGGSTQLTWLIARDGEIRMRPTGSISFPYGAAALSRLLAEAEANGPPQARETLAADMKSKFSTAYNDQLDIPTDLATNAEEGRGLVLYLSGGGFRGWGNLLMSQSSISPYPIPIINGFHVSGDEFGNISHLQQLSVNKEQQIFRISKRRASQLPAVAFLIGILTSSIPNIREIIFCQGGVREGYLFDLLDKATKAQDPLISASQPYAPSSADAIATLLTNALPLRQPLAQQHGREVGVERERASPTPPTSINPTFITALANLLYLHSSYHPTESAPLSSLHLPLTGALSSTASHGLSHKTRALLAITLYHRWSSGLRALDDLPPPHDQLYGRLCHLLDVAEIWWCLYLGKVARLVGSVYPAGRVRDARLGFACEPGEWESLADERKLEEKRRKGFKGEIKLLVSLPVDEGDVVGDPAPAPVPAARSATAWRSTIEEGLRDVEKVGKMKNRVRRAHISVGGGGATVAAMSGQGQAEDADDQGGKAELEPSYSIKLRVEIREVV